MNYNEYLPSETIAPYVRCYWNLENHDTSIPPNRERVFPDGCIELIFHYGDLFRKYHSDKHFVVQPRCFIHGQLKKFIELEATGRIGIFSVRFQPGGLQGFIDFDVSELTGKVIPVDEIWGRHGEDLADEILKATNPEQRIVLIEKFLLSRLSRTEHEQVLASCVDMIMNRHGNISIEELVSAQGISKRQIERIFTSGVGLSPKFMARIVRFNHTLQMIENKTFDNFTSVAFEVGFYDQAHFIKDFKELTGLNPKKYFSENLEMTKFFNLD
jgi:AraC-like DNA-binding protein